MHLRNSNTNNNNNNFSIRIRNFKYKNGDNDININTITATDNNSHNSIISTSTMINLSPNSTATNASRNIKNINSNSTRLPALTTILKVSSTYGDGRRSNGYNYNTLLNSGNNNSDDVISPIKSGITTHI